MTGMSCLAFLLISDPPVLIKVLFYFSCFMCSTCLSQPLQLRYLNCTIRGFIPKFHLIISFLNNFSMFSPLFIWETSSLLMLFYLCVFEGQGPAFCSIHYGCRYMDLNNYNFDFVSSFFFLQVCFYCVIYRNWFSHMI